jgi:hypothetical protein
MHFATFAKCIRSCNPDAFTSFSQEYCKYLKGRYIQHKPNNNLNAFKEPYSLAAFNQTRLENGKFPNTIPNP